MKEHIAGMGEASKPAQNKKSYSVAVSYTHLTLPTT